MTSIQQKEKKSFRPLYSQISTRRVCAGICCLISADCPPALPFYLMEGALLLWQSAIHSEGFTKQSFELWVSNKLIFVRVFLLRKEGQFYAGFYGWLHKGISLCASSLAGAAGSEIIVFSNQQLQWRSEKENHKLVYGVIFLGRLKHKCVLGLAVSKDSLLAACMCTAQGLATFSFSFSAKHPLIGYSHLLSWRGSETHLHFPGFPWKFEGIPFLLLMVLSVFGITLNYNFTVCLQAMNICWTI